jgi:hypothetical protein
LLVSCGGGKHEAEVKDSRLEHPDSAVHTDSGTIDSTNGAAVRPIDTAHSSRRNP